MNIKKLIIALAIFVVLAMLALVISVGVFVDQAIGGQTESIQSAVQPMHCVDVWADSLGVADSILVIPNARAAGLTFATSEACSVRVYSQDACVDTQFMHFEADECFEFPNLAADSALVVNKSAADKAFIRIWFWRQ